MMSNNQRIIAQQEELIHQLAWNDGFGCYTRKGFEKMKWPEIASQARFIIYFDIDGMHDLNEHYGSYEPVDAMIRGVLTSVRSTDIVAGQWKSGDEFLICLTENDNHKALDPEGFVRRLQAVEGLPVHQRSVLLNLKRPHPFSASIRHVE